MFQHSTNNTNQKKQSTLMRKKNCFQQSIRRQEKSRILQLLRETALLQQDITTCLATLPNSLDQLIDLLKLTQNKSVVWHHIVITRILAIIQTQPNSIFNDNTSPDIQIGLIMYILEYQPVTQEYCYGLWRYVEESSKKWQYQQQLKLLKLITLVYKRLHILYLRQAKKIINSSHSRITDYQLDFYNFVAKLQSHKDFIDELFNDQLFKKIILGLGLYFYSSNEKIKMCQILIQVLYLSQKQTVAADWQLCRMFDALQMLLTCSNDHKLLTERCLILIYNVNIDVSSKIFLIHPCVQVLAIEMRNADLPMKLREIMVQTYLSAVMNLAQGDLPKYIQKHFIFFANCMEYILEQFTDSKFLMENAIKVFQTILNIDGPNLQNKFTFKSNLISRPSLIEAIRRTRLGEELIDDWQLN